MCPVVDHDQCGAPEHSAEYNNAPCDAGSGDGVCEPVCVDSNKLISAVIPRYKPCGALGVYYWKLPQKNLVLPTCAGKGLL